MYYIMFSLLAFTLSRLVVNSLTKMIFKYVAVVPLAYANPVENAALQPDGPGQSAPFSKALRSK